MAVQVNVQANQQALINSIQQGVNAFNQRFAKSNTLNLNINERSFTQPLGRITGAVDDFGSAMAASNARVIAFGASTAVLGTAIASFRALAKSTIEVEKNLTDVNRILNLSTGQLQEFGRALFDISKRTATSFNDASKALLEFSRQGLSAEETLRRTNDALTLTRLAGLGAEASVAALTATVNGFAKSGINTTQVLNKLVAVEQAFAVSARDLSEGLARTGQAAQEAGADIDQLNALIAAAQQRTARGGAVIGNALKTIFTRLQRSDTLDRLEEFNIAVRDIQGNTLPATTILQNFAGAYDKLADAQRAQLSEQVAGVYQVNILKAVISDLNSEQSIYADALVKGTRATNEAAVANARLNQTVSALLVQVGNSTQQLASTIGSVTFDPLVKSAARAANAITESINNLITGDDLGGQLANGLLKGIRNVLAGPGAVAAFYTLFKLVQSSFTYVAQALPQIAGITTETQKRRNLEQAILGILQTESNISKSILGNTGNQAQQAKILLGVAQQQTNQYREQLRLAGSLATTLRGQGVSVGARGLQTRSGGYIPASTRMAERAGAFAGGYAPGKVVNSPVGGVMNTAEDVKYVPGFAQPFINPPRNSRAGKLHRANAVKQVGVDPYQYRGFVPNFASLSKGYMDLGDLDAFSRSRTELLKYAEINRKGNKLSKSNINLEDQVKFGFDKVVKFDATKVPGFQRVTNVRDSGLSKKAFGEAFEAAIIKSGKFGRIQLAHGLKGDFSSAVDMINTGSKITKLIEAKGGGYDAEITPFKTARAVAENLSDSRFNKMFTSPNQETLKNRTMLIENANYPTVKSKSSRGSRYGGYIPNFAAAYRNPFTGELNNAAIARGLRSGKLTQQQAQAMGYSTSGSKIEARKNKRAAAVNALNYTMAYVPWDIEGFRGGRSGGRLNIAQGTAYEKFILNLLRSGKLKGTTSLGAPFALPARPDVVSSAALKGGTSARIDGYSLSAGEMYEMKAGDPGATLAGLQNKFVKAIENNPEILNPKRKWKNYIFRTTAAKGRGASGGFIPNLAYKGEVMDLEEFISGQKAIYSESPFPHVRNESQPTFASAIADHGGLSNALKDSYRNQSAAGMVYGGYVPNFAAKYQTTEGAGIDVATGVKKAIDLTTDSQKKLDLELKNLIRLYKEGALTRRELIASTDKLSDENKLTLESQKRLRKNISARARSEDKKTKQNNKPESQGRGGFAAAGTALAIGGPLVAGFIEQAAFGNRQRTDMSAGERAGQNVLSTGLTTASTAFAIGGQFGVPGLIGAGVATAAITAASAIGAMSLSAEEFGQILDKYNQTTQENTGAAQNYIQALKTLETETDPEKLAKANTILEDEFRKIKDVNLSKAFDEAGGDVGKLTEALKTYEKERRQGSRRAEENVLAASLGEAGSSVKSLNQLGFTAEQRTVQISNGAGVFSAGPGAPAVSVRNYTALAEGQEGKILNAFSQTFEDLGSLTEEQLQGLQSALRREKMEITFDESDIRDYLTSLGEQSLDEGTASNLAGLFNQLEDSGNVVGAAIINNLVSLMQKRKENIDKASSQAQGRETLISNYRAFRTNLQNRLTQELEGINDRIRSFQADSSLQNMVYSKLNEINSNVFSSVINNANDISKFALRANQASFARDIAVGNANRAESQARGLSALNIQAGQTNFKQGVFKEITSQGLTLSGGEGGQQEQLSTFLNSEDFANKTREDITNFVTSLFAGEDGKLAPKYDTVIQSIDGAREKLENLTEEEQNKLNLAIETSRLEEFSANLNKQIADEQIKLDQERLRITLQQKAAAEDLRYAVESTRIQDQQAVELQRIAAGSQFRYAGLGRGEAFIARQADERSIFEKEQAMRQKQAIAEAQRSAIEIAAQQANINAQDRNTQAVLDLTLAMYAQETKDAVAAMDGNRISAASNNMKNVIAAQNNFNNRSNFNVGSLQGVSLNSATTIADAIAQTEAAIENATDETIKQGYEVQLNNLKLASEELSSSATVFEAAAAQSASDFQRSSGFVNNMKNGFLDMKSQSDTILDNLGRNIPNQFADGMANALTEVAQGTKKIGEAFEDVAIDFGRMIMKEVMRAAVARTLGSIAPGLFGNQAGGLIKAQNGMYVSGNRTGDRNLALLEDGEYVLNRNAVMKMGGPRALDKLNFKMAPRFNRGGSFSSMAGKTISGEFTGEAFYDYGNTASGIDPSNYTDFALQNDAYFQNLKEKRFERHMKKIEKKYNRKMRQAQLISSIVGAVGSMFLGAGLSGYSSASQAGAQGKSALNQGAMTAKDTATQDAMMAAAQKSDYSFGRFMQQNASSISINNVPIDTLAANMQNFVGPVQDSVLQKSTSGLSGMRNISSGISSQGFGVQTAPKTGVFQRMFNTGSNFQREFVTQRGKRQQGGLIGYNLGGFVPYGSRLSDTIPAMLTGGEYVMNNKAVKKYGLGTMNSMNAGAYQAGGEALSNSSTTNNTNNSTSISINVDRNGATTYGADTTSYKQNDIKFSKEMAKQINSMVIGIMSNEKRYGGELYKDDLRG